MISGSSGLVMVQGMPAAIDMATKVALSARRLGRPKEMLLAPQMVLHPSSSRTMRTMSKRCLPAPWIAPTGMASGSISTSARAMP